MSESHYVGRQSEIAESIFNRERHVTDRLSPSEFAQLLRIKTSSLRTFAVESGRLKPYTYYIVPPGPEIHPEFALYPAEDFLHFSVSFPTKEEMKKLAQCEHKKANKSLSFAFILDKVFEREIERACNNVKRYEFCLRHLDLLCNISYSVIFGMLRDTNQKMRYYKKEAECSHSAGGARFFWTLYRIAQREVSVLFSELAKRGSL